MTAIELEGGVLTFAGANKATTINVNGGTLHLNCVPSSGNCADTVNVDGGIVDTRQVTAARTIGTLNLDEGEFIADDDVVTVTTFDQPADLKRVTVARA